VRWPLRSASGAVGEAASMTFVMVKQGVLQRFW